MMKLAKRLSALSITAALVISMSGCSFGKDSSKQNNNTKQSEQKAKKEEAPKVQQDAKKTEQLKKEKEVYDGQVYFKDDSVIATMIIKEGISEGDAKALAEKYAKELKAAHKDKKINVQAVQKGNNIANITIEK
ncbi:hypothetical protein P8V03_15670 [Clostridium sp. A1-XYC3]|uniref:Lipoprotein n=1 Tax=Clostridium tanneri TaxID=3037988 RepID=A0ABU4JWP6_9CLOT|nr:hypothetical protein [Clostridium sp. A1-XYC3]MDW8802586.1 hypothetical protein [Clostridium sp. A1-XYC3]